jgi:hypothetical protein
MLGDWCKSLKHSSAQESRIFFSVNWLLKKKRGGGFQVVLPSCQLPWLSQTEFYRSFFFIDRLLTANETATINDVSCHLFHLFLALAKLSPSQSLFACLARNVRLFPSFVLGLIGALFYWREIFDEKSAINFLIFVPISFFFACRI